MEDKNLLKNIENTITSTPVPEEVSFENIDKKLSKICFPEEVRKGRRKRKIKSFIKGTVMVLAPVAAIFIVLSVCFGTVGILGVKYGSGAFYVAHNTLNTKQLENGLYVLTELEDIGKMLQKNELAYTLNQVKDTITLQNFFSSKSSTVGGILSNGSSYVDTETRMEGVREGDIIVTDGEYIYSYGDVFYDKIYRNIQIIKADVETTQVVNTIAIGEYLGRDYEMSEMYIYEDTLVVLCQTYYDYYEEYKNKVKTLLLDVSDVQNPKLINVLQMDGYYKSSRITGDYLYTFTSISYYRGDGTLVPSVNGKILEAADIYVGNVLWGKNSNNLSVTYNIITGLSLKDTDDYMSKVAVISNSNQEYYVSGNNIYMYYQITEILTCSCNRALYSAEDAGKAYIMKFTYDEGMVTPEDRVFIKGNINDTFCIDEYNEYLRVVASIPDTRFTRTNSLYILDENLDVVSTVDGIAPGEVVTSALFMGDIGYFVTYDYIKVTDPLFSVDLSDPENPVLLGSLKLPGYSDYMHIWNDGLLLGFGYNEDFSEKLSLFDVSDPLKLVEVSTAMGEDGYEYCDMYPEEYKYKLVSPEKNIIGFFCEKLLWDGSDIVERKNVYTLYKVEDKELKLVESIELSSLGMENGIFTPYIRGIYIDDYIYVVVPNHQVVIYDVTEDKIVADIDI